MLPEFDKRIVSRLERAACLVKLDEKMGATIGAIAVLSSGIENGSSALLVNHSGACDELTIVFILDGLSCRGSQARGFQGRSGAQSPPCANQKLRRHWASDGLPPTAAAADRAIWQ
jgi:hypothetical protein